MLPRVAVLVDGGYFLRRLPRVRPFPKNDKVLHIVRCLDLLVNGHLDKIAETYKPPTAWALLHRIFYYDARPYKDQAQKPISKKNLNYSLTIEAKQREELFEKLRQKRKYALRLGHVYREKGWSLREDRLKDVLQGVMQVANLVDEDFELGLRQKGVDMRIGMDIATMSVKRQVDKIVLVSGDSDFVPVAKLARREGVEVILDPMWWNVPEELLEHVDGTWNGLSYPKGNSGNKGIQSGSKT